MPRSSALELPPWAVASPKRRKHVARVVRLLEKWGTKMRLSPDERARWRAAGVLHDALRDADEPLLRRLSGERTRAAELLHGPAAARRAMQDGETRSDVLDAVRFHTIGSTSWARTGRALYMADFLEPGRKFLRGKRARIARRVPSDFDGAYRDVVRLRLEWCLHEGGELFPESVALWHAVR